MTMQYTFRFAKYKSINLSDINGYNIRQTDNIFCQALVFIINKVVKPYKEVCLWFIDYNMFNQKPPSISPVL